MNGIINFFSLLFGVLFLAWFCQPNKANDDNLMTISGTVKGLRKGTLFLQKVKDSLIINVDSVLVAGSPDFELYHQIEEPEIYYLYLEKKDSDSLNDVITFFGEPGNITINTQLRTFESSAIVKGSENQLLLQKFISQQRRFRDNHLDLLQDYFNATKNKNTMLADSLQRDIDNLVKRRYLYAINYAVQNSDKHIAPYIALTQVLEAQTVWLDTIANQLSDEVSHSKYGRELIEYIERRKLDELETK
ncbi:MAG: DUF4369 domain-containing protein [Flavobacteriaceae bacterium]|nr:DUF4369 domain-containing protein [Flavobacteriaceae bacterium]